MAIAIPRISPMPSRGDTNSWALITMTKQCQGVGNVYRETWSDRIGKIKIGKSPHSTSHRLTRGKRTWATTEEIPEGRDPRAKLGHTFLWLACVGVYNSRREAETPLKQFVMSSLESAYFASSVAGAIFFGETVLRAACTVFTARSRIRCLCCSGVHGFLLTVRLSTILRVKRSGLPAPAFAVAAGERKQSRPS